MQGVKPPRRDRRRVLAQCLCGLSIDHPYLISLPEDQAQARQRSSFCNNVRRAKKGVHYVRRSKSGPRAVLVHRSTEQQPAIYMLGLRRPFEQSRVYYRVSDRSPPSCMGANEISWHRFTYVDARRMPPVKDWLTIRCQTPADRPPDGLSADPGAEAVSRCANAP